MDYVKVNIFIAQNKGTQTFIILFSFVTDQVEIQKMPDKPDRFKVQGESDTSLAATADQSSQTSQPAPIQQQPTVPAAISGSEGAIGGQGIVEISFKYPDGRVEVISVVNAESVHRIAKAEQVIRPPGYSASFPQTAAPRGLDTSSLPDVLPQAPTTDAPDVDQPTAGSSGGPSDDKDRSEKKIATGGEASTSAKGKRKIKKATKYTSVSSPLVLNRPIIRPARTAVAPAPRSSGGNSFSTALVRYVT